MKKIIENICIDFAQNKKFSGTCMVKKGEEIIYKGAYGYANRAFHIPNTIDTKFDTASITKTFTAVAIMQLVEKEKLHLDDNIADLIDLANTKIPNDVKIEHLLNHTSGIADDADEEAGEDYSALFKDSPNYALRECIDFLKNFVYKEPNFKAGTKVRYNNCAYILLGLAIEKLTKMDYRTYVTKNIFELCHMRNSGFLVMDEINENTAEGYLDFYNQDGEFIGYKKNIYSYPPIGTADSGAYTTVEDLDIFLRAIKNGQILSEEYCDMLFTPHCEFTRQSSWKVVSDAVVRNGYAFEFLELDGESFCISKDGCNEGVSAITSYYPKADITVSILANQNCNVWQMHREIQTEIYKQFYMVE